MIYRINQLKFTFNKTNNPRMANNGEKDKDTLITSQLAAKTVRIVGCHLMFESLRENSRSSKGWTTEPLCFMF